MGIGLGKKGLHHEDSPQKPAYKVNTGCLSKHAPAASLPEKYLWVLGAQCVGSTAGFAEK